MKVTFYLIALVVYTYATIVISGEPIQAILEITAINLLLGALLTSDYYDRKAKVEAHKNLRNVLNQVRMSTDNSLLLIFKESVCKIVFGDEVLSEKPADFVVLSRLRKSSDKAILLDYLVKGMNVNDDADLFVLEQLEAHKFEHDLDCELPINKEGWELEKGGRL